MSLSKPIRIFLWVGFSLTLLVLSAAGAAAWWANDRLEAKGPAESQILLIPPGSGMAAIAAKLVETGHAPHPLFVPLAARWLKLEQRLQAGEYAIPAGASLHAVLDQLAAGLVVERHLTIPEGLTAVEISRLINQAEALTGTVTPQPEASLLPETYDYRWGQDRQVIQARMRDAMAKTLNDLWRDRSPDLPLKSPQEALILASIVEKETGIARERPQVAAVFINRLRAGMRLQSDPTVSYGLTLGRFKLNRPLTRADWLHDSPYNTYRIDGLPPGPIATPGRAALYAVLHPANTRALYFVADGSGGHAFAETLDDHNRNVARWRALKLGN